MPLTSGQLAALTAPPGWILRTHPSLRTAGWIVVDHNQALSGTNCGERLTALIGWAKNNSLGLKAQPTSVPAVAGYAAYAYLNTHYFDLRFPTIFKVSANHPEYTDQTFGEYTCFCGQQTSNWLNPACDHCGRVYCEFCNLSFLKMWKVDTAHGGSAMACEACTVKCKQKPDCPHRVPPGVPCSACSPTYTCAVCFQKKEVSDSAITPSNKEDLDVLKRRYERQYGRHSKGDPRVCEPCAKAYRCKTCKEYDFSKKPTTNGECVLCAGKELEKERLKHEAFPEGWVPRHGSLVIPSVDFRPFRTISYELELDGDGDLVAQTLYRCGLVPMSTVAGYQHHPVEKDAEYPCFMKHDGSVSAGEIIAYLLNLDDAKHAEALLDTCRKVNSLVAMKKASFGPRCGGHIHVDAHNFSYGDVWRLLTVFNYLEDVIYRIAGAGSPTGHRSLDPGNRDQNGEGYTISPVKGPFGTKGALGRSIQGQRRNSGLNFTPYISSGGNCQCGAMAYEDSKNCKCNLGKSTIEFRVFNSTANPRILHAWIALVQALMAWSEGDADPTPDWEAQYEAFPWSQARFTVLPAATQDKVRQRLEWIFRNLPLTEDERDSLAYAVEQTDITLSRTSPNLRAIVPLNDFPYKKPPRNPARRQRAIKVAAPTPGEPEKPAYVTGRGGQPPLAEILTDELRSAQARIRVRDSLAPPLAGRPVEWTAPSAGSTRGR